MKVYMLPIDGEIVPDDFFGGVTSKHITEQINKAKQEKAESINLLINSPGGDVYQGFAIYNTLKASGLKITATIQSLCASIATLIACAAEEVNIYPAAQVMFHLPSGGRGGTASDLESTAEALRQIEDVMIDVYAGKTKKDKAVIRDILEKETYMAPKQAKEFGFVDHIIEPVAAFGTLQSRQKSTQMNLTAKFKDAFKAVETAIAEMKGDTPQAGQETLADGTTLIYFDGDLEEKKTVFMDPEMTKPAGEGEWTLNNGKVIVTDAAGVITEIKEPAGAGAGADEQVQALQAQLAEVTALKDSMQAEVDKLKADHQAAIAKINTEFTALKSTISSAGVNIKSDPQEPTGKKITAGAHPLDRQAEEFKKTLLR